MYYNIPTTSTIKPSSSNSKAIINPIIKDNEEPYPPLPSSPPPVLTPSPIFSRSPIQTNGKLIEEYFQRLGINDQPSISTTTTRTTTSLCCLNCNEIIIPSDDIHNIKEDEENFNVLNNQNETTTTNKPVKYERKSPIKEVENDENYITNNVFHNLPWNVMYNIFDTLELKDRIECSMVCHRWNRLLTDGRFPISDLVVLNIFETTVWENTLSKSSGARLQCYNLTTMEQFETVLMHCNQVTSVKIWYMNKEFTRNILEMLKDCNVKMRSLDIYPYSEEIGIENFHEFLPQLRGLTMRPHAKKFFFSGISLFNFPFFQKLNTLHLDSINLGSEVELPKNLTTLEWQNRSDVEFRKFLPKLNPLKNLEYLLIGHADFKIQDFEEFLGLIQFNQMKNLQFLLFKFVKLECLKCLPENFHTHTKMPLLNGIQFLKFDLCTGDLVSIIHQFVNNLTGEKLRYIALNIISDNLQHQFEQLFNYVSRKLYEKKIMLHLGLLQKETQLKNDLIEYPKITKYFEKILTNFEASFVSDSKLIRIIFAENSKYTNLTELKFIQCSAITNPILEIIALNCLQLKKLSLLSCNDCCEIGIRHFVELFHLRLSMVLKIIWKRDRRTNPRPANFFLNLVNEYSHLLNGYRSRFMCKIFNEGHNGETVLVWKNKKMLFIQDYDENEKNRILCVQLK